MSSKSTVSVNQRALQKRFLLIVILFPLCICTVLTTVSVYRKLMKNMVLDYFDYAVCMSNTNTTSRLDAHCPATYRKYRSVTVAIIDLLMFDIFSVVLVAYILVPPTARSFWVATLSRLLGCLPKFACRSGGRKKHMKLGNMKLDEEDGELDDIGEGECESINDASSQDSDS